MREVRPALTIRRSKARYFTPAGRGHELDAQEFALAMPMGLACCAIELMATAAAVSTFRGSARGDAFFPAPVRLMIVAAPSLTRWAGVKRIYEQIRSQNGHPMGAALDRRMYRSYAVLQGIDQLLPVDVYVSGFHASRSAP